MCLVCAPGGQGLRAFWSLLCSSATQHKGCSSLNCVQHLPECPPHPPTLGVSPADQSPGRDSEAWVPDSEERLILREEFTSRMHQRFLDGKDGDFDYRCFMPLPPRPPTQHPVALSCMPGPGISMEGLRVARRPQNSSRPWALGSDSLRVSDQPKISG